jgi:hypothetical protein
MTRNVDKKGFEFNRRFWIGLAFSYFLFLLLVVVPFFLGYIDSTLLGYGLVGTIESLILIIMVRSLNRKDIFFRKRVGFVLIGVWLGFAVGFFGGTLLFGHQLIAAIGSLAFFVLVILALPIAGGLIGYLVGAKKYSNPNPKINQPKT